GLDRHANRTIASQAQPGADRRSATRKKAGVQARRRLVENATVALVVERKELPSIGVQSGRLPGHAPGSAIGVWIAAVPADLDGEKSRVRNELRRRPGIDRTRLERSRVARGVHVVATTIERVADHRGVAGDRQTGRLVRRIDLSWWNSEPRNLSGSYLSVDRGGKRRQERSPDEGSSHIQAQAADAAGSLVRFHVLSVVVWYVVGRPSGAFGYCRAIVMSLDSFLFGEPRGHFEVTVTVTPLLVGFESSCGDAV